MAFVVSMAAVRRAMAASIWGFETRAKPSRMASSQTWTASRPQLAAMVPRVGGAEVGAVGVQVGWAPDVVPVMFV
jgi:beta-glucosidase-like glycosyl hydrolase